LVELIFFREIIF